MAVKPREVKNRRNADGILTGKPGTVYDVNLKYKTPTGIKTYSKKGFATQTPVSYTHLDVYKRQTLYL